MSYQLRPDGLVIRMADGAVIPADPRNADRQRFDAWVAEGNVPAATPAPPQPDPNERLIAKTTIYRRATDAELEMLEATLPALPRRLRLLWQDAEGGLVRLGDVRPLFVEAVGEDRAAELLA
jgi:hypothetical protein